MKMTDVNIHHVQSIKIEKYQLNSGTWICKIDVFCKIKLTGQESYENITLFSENKETYKSFVEVD